MVRRRGGLWVSSSRHGHQRETQRRTRLNETGKQQGDAGADGRLVETEKPSQGAGLRICDGTRHRRGGEFGTTGHQLGFQALRSLGCRQLLAQTQHGRARRTALLEGQVRALAAASPDVQGHCRRGQLGLDHIGRPVPTKCGELSFITLHLGFPAVAGCRLGGMFSNDLATGREHKPDRRGHRPGNAPQPQHEASRRQRVLALTAQAQHQQWRRHLEDVGCHTGCRVGGLVDRGLAEGQAILQVRAEAHRTEGGYCRIAAHPKQAISAFDADQFAVPCRLSWRVDIPRCVGTQLNDDDPVKQGSRVARGSVRETELYSPYWLCQLCGQGQV